MKYNKILDNNQWKSYFFDELLEEINIKNKNSQDFPVLTVSQGRGIILQSEKFNKEIASEDKTGYKCVPKESIVFNPNYLNFGAIGTQDIVEIGLVSSIYGVFKIKKPDLLNYNFLKYLIRSSIMTKEYNKFANGSSAIVLTGELHGMHVRLSVSIKDFKKIKWMYPSLKEQEKIAEILTIVDNKIKNTEQLIEKTKEFKNGLMNQLLTKGIGHKEYKQTKFGEIPNEWEIKKLSEIGEIITGSTPSTKNEEFWNGDINFISPADIDENKYIEGSVRKVTKHGSNKGREIPKYSILVTCIGSTIGKLGINKEKCLTNQQINSIIPFKDINFSFIYYSLLFNKKELRQLQSTTAIPMVNKSTFSKLEILFPPAKEQLKIVSILSSVDDQFEKYEQEKAKYQELKKGLIQQLITGQLRVKM